MSATLLWAVLAVAATTLLLWPLALRDPKRLRAAARVNAGGSVPHSLTHRHVLGWMSLLPGLALIVAGQWPAFLIWLGGTVAIGWGLANALSPRARTSA